MKKLLLSLLCLAGLGASAQTYQLVTEVTTADLGTSEYILVGKNETEYYAMGATSAANVTTAAYRKAVKITVSNNACDLSQVKGVATFKIVKGTETDSYALQLASGDYITFTGTKSDKLNEKTELTKQGSFSLAFAKAGNAEFVNCNYDARGLKFNYNNGKARFANYSKTGTNQPFGFLYKLTASKEVATPAFSVAAGAVEAGTKVAISCETEGAAIYYTLDGTAPTKESTPYTEEITINETTTVKAIAYVGDKDSNVASATYTVVVPDTFEEVLAMANGDTFMMGTPLTVALHPSGDARYIYVYADGKYALLYDASKAQTLAAGDVIKSGWNGKMVYYSGLPELTTSETLATTGEAATVPDPAVVEAANITNAMVNNIVKVKGVEFAAATQSVNKVNFTGKVGDTELTFRNTFAIEAVDAGKYDVTCVVSVFESKATTLGSTIQLLPVMYEKDTTGIADIEADNNVAPVYYNLQGVRVANPENGMFIEVRGNKAVKVIK